MVQCLTLMSGLPSRAAASVTASQAGYFVALDGVGLWSLQEAARAILRKSLGHGFFPSPSELRGECDRIMEPIRELQRMDARARRIEQENREHAPRPARSAEEIERHTRLMESFNARFVSEADRKLEAERAEIRERFGMTEEVLSKIRDRETEIQRIGEINWKT